ncbi:MAG: Crp/Fnr family transcriptional regulator [Desulfobacter sp.]|nr:MAG: Crp/Fnr family transcriptional regulator [Desulfobacter sp.]
MEAQDFQRILKTLKLEVNLGRAPEASLMELAQSARLQNYKKDEYVFHAGDESEYVHLLEKGRIILSKASPSGRSFTFLIAVKGTTLNAVTCFMARRRFFCARVAETATVVAIPSPIFKQWVLSHPKVAAGILNTMGDLLDGAYTRILDLIDESAENRILNALNMLCSRIGPDLPLRNRDVAEMTGVSRETAARVISNLQKLSLISKSRGTIRILDPSQLQDLSTSPFFIL